MGADPRYISPSEEGKKKAISKPDIKKIFEYEPISDLEAFNRDLWIFSYLCNGINLADIARLKYKNIVGDSIVLIRQKTSGKRKLQHIEADYSIQAKKIIDRWGQQPDDPDIFIFPILTKSMNEERRVTAVNHITRGCNVHMKRIAGKIGIDPNISTYYARHSFATTLKLSGENIAYISESLGHSNLKITEVYLSKFDSKARKKATSTLTDFD